MSVLRTPGARPVPRDPGYEKPLLVSFSSQSGRLLTAIEAPKVTPIPPAANRPAMVLSSRPGRHYRATSQYEEMTVVAPENHYLSRPPRISSPYVTPSQTRPFGGGGSQSRKRGSSTAPNRSRAVLTNSDPALIVLIRELEEVWTEYYTPMFHRDLFRSMLADLSTRDAMIEANRELRELKMGVATVQLATKAVESREQCVTEMRNLSNCIPDAALKAQFLETLRRHRTLSQKAIEAIATWGESLLHLCLQRSSRHIPIFRFLWKDENYLKKMQNDTFFLTCSLWTTILRQSEDGESLLSPVAVHEAPRDNSTLLRILIQFEVADSLAHEVAEEEVYTLAAEALLELEAERLLSLYTREAVVDTLCLRVTYTDIMDLSAARIALEVVAEWFSEVLEREFSEALQDWELAAIARKEVDDYYFTIAGRIYEDYIADSTGIDAKDYFDLLLREEIGEWLVSFPVDSDSLSTAYGTLLCELIFDTALRQTTSELADTCAIEEISDILYHSYLRTLSIQVIDVAIGEFIGEELLAEGSDTMTEVVASEGISEVIYELQVADMERVLITEIAQTTVDEYFSHIAALIYDGAVETMTIEVSLAAAVDCISEDFTEELPIVVAKELAIDALIEEQTFEELVAQALLLTAEEGIIELISDMVAVEWVESTATDIYPVAGEVIIAFQVAEELTDIAILPLDRVLWEAADDITMAQVSEELSLLAAEQVTAAVVQEAANEDLFESAATDLLMEFAVEIMGEAVEEERNHMADAIFTAMADSYVQGTVVEELVDFLTERMEAELVELEPSEAVEEILVDQYADLAIAGALDIDAFLDLLLLQHTLADGLECECLVSLLCDGLHSSIDPSQPFEFYLRLVANCEIVEFFCEEISAQAVEAIATRESIAAVLAETMPETIAAHTVEAVVSSEAVTLALDEVVPWVVATAAIDSIVVHELQLIVLSETMPEYVFAGFLSFELLPALVSESLMESNILYPLAFPSDAEVAEIPANDSLTVEFFPVGVHESCINRVLEKVSTSFPAQYRLSEDQLPTLQRMMKHGVDPCWQWAAAQNYIVGLVAYYRDTSQDLCLCCVAAFSDSLQRRLIQSAINALFQNYPCNKCCLLLFQSDLSDAELRKYENDFGLCLYEGKCTEETTVLAISRKEVQYNGHEEWTDCKVYMKVAVSAPDENIATDTAINSLLQSTENGSDFLRIFHPMAEKHPADHDPSHSRTMAESILRSQQWDSSQPDKFTMELRREVIWMASESRLLTVFGTSYEAVRFPAITSRRIGKVAVFVAPTDCDAYRSFFMTSDMPFQLLRADTTEDLYRLVERLLQETQEAPISKPTDLWIPKFSISSGDAVPGICELAFPNITENSLMAGFSVGIESHTRPSALGQLIPTLPPSESVSSAFVYGLAETAGEWVSRPVVAALVGRSVWKKAETQHSLRMETPVEQEIADILMEGLLGLELPLAVSEGCAECAEDELFLDLSVSMYTDAITHLARELNSDQYARETAHLSSVVFDTISTEAVCSIEVLQDAVLDAVLEEDSVMQLVIEESVSVTLLVEFMYTELLGIVSREFIVQRVEKIWISDLAEQLLESAILSVSIPEVQIVVLAHIAESTLDDLTDALVLEVVTEPTEEESHLYSLLVNALLEEPFLTEIYNSAVLELEPEYRIGLASDAVLQRLAENPSLAFHLVPLEVIESHLSIVLIQLAPLTPPSIRANIETPQNLLATLRRGVDPRWFWVRHDTKIVGLVAGYRDPSLPQTKCFTIRHVMALHEKLYYRVINDSAQFLFETQPFDEVRVALAKEELSKEEKAALGELGFRWKAYNKAERVSVLGKPRPEAWKGFTIKPSDIDIVAVSRIDQTSDPIPQDFVDYQTLGNRPGLAQILSAAFSSNLPQAQNTLQGEILDRLRLRSLTAVPFWVGPQTERLAAVMEKSCVWPGSETRGMVIDGVRYECTRFYGVRGSQGSIEARTSTVSVFIVPTDLRNLSGVFVVGNEVTEGLSDQEDLYRRVERTLQVPPTQEAGQLASARIDELWVPKFNIEATCAVPWMQGVSLESGAVTRYCESVKVTSARKPKLAGQVTSLLMRGHRITKPFVFSTLYAGLVDSTQSTLPLLVVQVQREHWLPQAASR